MTDTTTTGRDELRAGDIIHMYGARLEVLEVGVQLAHIANGRAPVDRYWAKLLGVSADDRARTYRQPWQTAGLVDGPHATTVAREVDGIAERAEAMIAPELRAMLTSGTRAQKTFAAREIPLRVAGYVAQLRRARIDAGEPVNADG